MAQINRDKGRLRSLIDGGSNRAQHYHARWFPAKKPQERALRGAGFVASCRVTRARAMLLPVGQHPATGLAKCAQGFRKGLRDVDRPQRFTSVDHGAGVAGLLASGLVPAGARQQQQQPQGWFRVCSKQQDIDVCNVQNILTAQTGQLVTGISLIELKGKVNRKVFQVSVPSGRMVPPWHRHADRRRQGASSATCSASRTAACRP